MEESPGQDNHTELVEVIRGPIDALDARGLTRPSGMTLEHYFQHFIDHKLLKHSTVNAWLALHAEVRYGGRLPDASVVREVTRNLLDEIRQMDELTAKARLPATGEFPALEEPSPEPVVTESADIKLAHDALEEMIVRQIEDRPEKKKMSKDNRIRLFATGVFLWSIVMIIVGHTQSQNMTNWVNHLRRLVFGPQPISLEQRVTYARNRAHANWSDLDSWREYGNTAFQAKNYSEAIVAWTFVIDAKPDDADVLNSLAWLLATAEDSTYVRPRQALKLAERAYALDKRSHVLDTLATAYWRMGNSEKAIELEKQALEKTHRVDNRIFYQDQLRRFMNERPAPPTTYEQQPYRNDVTQ